MIPAILIAGLVLVAAPVVQAQQQRVTATQSQTAYNTAYLACVTVLFPPLSVEMLASGKAPNSKIYSWDADKQRFLENCMEQKGFALVMPDYTGTRTQVQRYTPQGNAAGLKPVTGDVRPERPGQGEAAKGILAAPKPGQPQKPTLWVPRAKPDEKQR